MGLLQLESTWWRFVTALALLGLGALAFLVYLRKLKRKQGSKGTRSGPAGPVLPRDPKWVSREIERLCSGQALNESLVKQMSAEDRALFEVSVIDALNNRTREGQHRLRSALIEYGYDEQCARRVMSEDLSDRVRATALLSLLRPQWRKEPLDPEERLPSETSRARAARSATGPLEPE